MGNVTPIDMDDLDSFDWDGLDMTLPEEALPRDPAKITYPPTLPVEVALRTVPLPEIKAAYGFSDEEWSALKHNPLFIRDLKDATEALKEEGMSFKTKARLQAEELLTTSWNMIHDKAAPANVRADLLKFTIRAAGLDGSKDQGKGDVGTAMQININLG